MTPRYLPHALATLVVALLTTSCELETSGNGKLDGYWHMERVDTIATGGVRDVSDQLLFWSFQNKLLMLNDRSGANPTCIVHFDAKTEPNVILTSSPYISDRANGDVLIEDYTILWPYGITDLNESINIDHLSGSKMILRDELVIITFRRL